MTRLALSCSALWLMCSGLATAQSSRSPEREAERAASARAAAAQIARATATQSGVGETAVVEKSRIRVIIPRPAPSRQRSAEPTVGYFAWYIVVPEPSPFTMVLIADSAMRATDLRDVLRASTLRLCPSVTPGSLRECTKQIAAKVEQQVSGIRITIDDADIVTRLRRERPVYCTVNAIEPRGRVQSTERVWVYKDGGPK